jgi:hypothetical protein
MQWVPLFSVVAVTRMQIFTKRCPRINISRNTGSVQHNHKCEITRASAWRVQITYPSNWATDGRYADISFADTRRSAQLRHAYRFESEKLLNPANQREPFLYSKNMIFQKS